MNKNKNRNNIKNYVFVSFFVSIAKNVMKLMICDSNGENSPFSVNFYERFGFHDDQKLMILPAKTFIEFFVLF